MREHLAQAVADGRLTQAQADERLAGAQEKFTALVNGQMPPGGPRGPRTDGPPPGEGDGTEAQPSSSV
jgi:hypothetical protein